MKKKFETEKADYTAKEGALDEEVRNLAKELNDEENKQETPAPAEPTPAPENERKAVRTMETRKFFGMNIQERDAFFAREDVKIKVISGDNPSTVSNILKQLEFDDYDKYISGSNLPDDYNELLKIVDNYTIYVF